MSISSDMWKLCIDMSRYDETTPSVFSTGIKVLSNFKIFIEK